MYSGFGNVNFAKITEVVFVALLRLEPIKVETERPGLHGIEPTHVLHQTQVNSRTSAYKFNGEHLNARCSSLNRSCCIYRYSLYIIRQSSFSSLLTQHCQHSRQILNSQLPQIFFTQMQEAPPRPEGPPPRMHFGGEMISTPLRRGRCRRRAADPGKRARSWSQ